MKMVKKILLGLAAGAAVLSLLSCGLKDDNNKAMGGTADKPKIEYENTGSENYRCYKATTFSHAGAIVKVVFENPTESEKSKMGVIFDLHKNKTNSNAVDFYIIGLASNSDCPNFYVSKLENVTDLQADNFGTKLANNPAIETEIIELATGTKIKSDELPALATDGSRSYYIYYKALKEGKYEYAVLDMTDATAKKLKAKDLSISSMPAGVTVIKSGTISNAFDAVDADNKVPQNKIGCYAMVPPSKTLKGHWDFFDTYLEAEEIEE